MVLLQNGANRDAQDNKDETPLFLAAREGSYEAAKVLLDHFANRDVTDHMDRLPRDIAQERLHLDIVNLLDKHHSENSMLNGFHQPQHSVMPFMQNGAKKKRKQHKSRSLSASNREPRSISPHSKQQVVKLPSVNKKSKAKEAEASATVTSPSTNSPEGSTVEMPPPYETAIRTGHLGAHSQPNVHSLNNLVYPPTSSCCYSDQCLSCVDGELTTGACNKSSTQGSLDLDNIKVEELSPENLFSPIGGESDGSHTRIPSHSLSSPTSGYNTVGSSPYSAHNSPHSTIQSPHSQTSSPMYPSSRSPPESVPSPQQRKPHLALSPTHYQAMQHQMQNSNRYQFYPTPPSQHGQPTGADTTPPLAGLTDPHPAYLTPSPDSPGHWSSSSPNSAQSDWSEGISSPPQPIASQHTQMYSHNPQQHKPEHGTNRGGNAVYL